VTTPFELKLTGMAHGGSALGRHEGRIVFVPYTIPGETITARIREDKRKFAAGEVVEVIEESSDRVEPQCPHFGPGKCGGCQWQHISYRRQLELKREVVIDQLRRVGKLDDPVVHPTIASPVEWGYRHHSTFTSLPDGRLGFYSDDNSRVVPLDTCLILNDSLLELFGQLSFDDETIERIKFQAGSEPDDRMIVLMTADDLAPEVEVDFPISINLLLSDNEPVNLIGSPQVTYRVFDRAFRVTAGGFFQVNPPMAEVLIDLVLQRLNLQGGESVLDLYSGVGLFTAFIAERAEYVLSVESYPPAVTDAEINLDDLDNIDLVEGPVEDVLEDLDGPFDAVVVDPPRTGMNNEVIDELVRLNSPTIIYVSCDPATLARDVQKLVRQGYRLIDTQPVDMFPQTYHIESIATLCRQ
jgi:23S rRNA (uracil1939-C5)-methyltransferase